MSAMTLAAFIARCRVLCRPRAHVLDAELLRRFTHEGDADAFALLLERYAALVWGVCRRIVPRASDCEDAFQATFVALVRRPEAVDPNQALGAWLHTIAVRVARRTLERSRRQQPLPVVPERATAGDVADDVSSSELLRMVDEEIERLPITVRTPLILCCLEGRTRDEAAETLGCSVAAVKSRLERGRNLLRRRLARRGVELPAAFLVLGLTSDRIRAGLWAKTMQSALHPPAPAVAALAEAALLAFSTTGKCKVILAALLLATGVAGALLTLNPEETPASPQAKAASVEKKAEPPRVRTDRHDDPLPDGATARLGTVRWRHGFFVFALAFSPDGTKIAAVGAGRDITLWDAATGKEIHQFPNKVDQPVGLAFSPDGKTIITSARKGILTFWDVDSGKEVRQLQGSRSGSRVAFAPDGKTLAASNYDDTVRMWDLATGKEQRRLKCEQKGLYGLAFSPDGNLLATAGVDGTIRFWDPRTEEARRRLAGHGKDVSRVVFSPNGKLLASSSEDNTIRFWDVATGQQLWKREERVFGHQAIAFSPDGTLLASGHLDGTIAIWDVASREEKRRWQTGSMRVFTLAFSPDGKTLAAASSMESTIHLWDVATGRERSPFEEHHAAIRSLRFSPDGAKLVSIGQDQQVLHWDLATNTACRQFVWKGEPLDVTALSPDGHTLAVGARADNEVRLWDVRTGKPGRVLGKHEEKKSIRGIAFSPDGKLLAAGYGDGTFRLWNAASGEERWHRHAGVGRARNVAFSPDGKTLATTVLWDGCIRLWDAETGRERFAVESHHGPITTLRFSADRSTLISAGFDRTVQWWDLATQKPRRQFTWNSENFIRFALSPDGNTVAAVSDWKDHELGLWDVRTGKSTKLPGNHQATIHSVAFSPDRRLVASGAMDGLIRVWDVREGKELRQIKGFTPQNSAMRLLFSPDSKTLASATRGVGNDVIGRLWDVASGKECRVFAGRLFSECPAAFSPDGKVLATVNDPPRLHVEYLVRLWDTTTGKELCRHDGHRISVGPVAFSPDGKLVASGGGGNEDNSIHVWEAATGRLIRRFDGHHSWVLAVAFAADGLTLASSAGDSTILLWDITGRQQDGKLPPAALTPRQLETCWKALAHPDAAKAYDAVWKLVAAPEQAVPFLGKHLTPVSTPDAKLVAQRLAEFDRR
jgi:RNA polymerase sigma factor (sigma-70 family)